MSHSFLTSPLARAALAGASLSLILAGVSAAQKPPAKGAAPKPDAAVKAAAPTLVPTAVPTKPTDPIAIVNGQPITRGQLADECVAQHGAEVLETMIARKLVQQAVSQKKLNITATDVEQEIERNAQAAGLTRAQFLQMLAKERSISPRQYADYIAYPTLALRKLAEPRVQVTDADMNEAFQAHFGEQLRCRVIMVDTIQKAKDAWNAVRSNPGGFAKIAQERSMDPGTSALGGLLADPIVRFANPRAVSVAAFAQLVDGDPADKDPEHKPKDGDFTGPIQVSEAAWIILKRESLEPGKEVDRQDKAIQDQLRAVISQAKLEAEMQEVMEELMDASEIDNQLTGQTKLAQAEEDKVKVDGKVERMSKPDVDIPATPGTSAAPGGARQAP